MSHSLFFSVLKSYSSVLPTSKEMPSIIFEICTKVLEILATFSISRQCDINQKLKHRCFIACIPVAFNKLSWNKAKTYNWNLLWSNYTLKQVTYLVLNFFLGQLILEFSVLYNISKIKIFITYQSSLILDQM